MAGVMIAAPGSGSGKTMVTCGLLTLLKGRDIIRLRLSADRTTLTACSTVGFWEWKMETWTAFLRPEHI